VADTEPGAGPERLTDVRPDPRPSPDHAGHDRWLVVRWSTDPADLTSAETAEARALLAACSDCATLGADLGLIRHATATSIVPARPRDFRLTPSRAAASRGGILHRARRWLASPGASAVRPLAGAAVTMGLVLVILAPGLPTSLGTTGDGTGGEAAPITAPQDTQAAKATEPAPRGPAGAGPEAGLYMASPDPAAQMDTTMRAADSPAPTDSSDTAAFLEASVAPDAPGADVREDGDTQADDAARTAPMDDTTSALTLLGIVLAGVGLLVLLFSWLARRWQDPLLR
jgi:hypothetical protein